MHVKGEEFARCPSGVWFFSITPGKEFLHLNIHFFAHLMLVTCLRPKQNVVLSRRTHHKHETAPLSLYNRQTITLLPTFWPQKLWSQNSAKVTVRPGPGA